jgi:hypothetical protein
MQPTNEQAVMGDFNDAEYNGRSVCYREVKALEIAP